MGLQPSLDGKGYLPIRSSGLINPTIFFFIFRVGLIHTLYLPFRWRGATRSVGSAAHRKIHTSIVWMRTTDRNQPRAI